MYLRANSTFYRLSLPALNLASLLFKTISFVNLSMKARRQKHFPDLFIISVDSLSFGGTGKTPLVMAIGRALEKRSLAFAIISRGYRSAYEKKGARVEPTHTVAEVGDEPWLFKKHFPNQDVIIGRDRLRSMAMATARKNRFIIMDDGLQTSQVRKDFSIMLVNPGHPYFYLRHFKFMMQRENMVLQYRGREQQAHKVLPGTYAFSGEGFWDVGNNRVDVGAARMIAFSALGDNERFKHDMAHYQLAAFRNFPDHHTFTAADIHALEALRREKGASWMVCTEKDFCKLNTLLEPATPLIYFQNKIELPDNAIEDIIKHAAEKGFL
ncbi:MAG: tetraacyldisaccharide 4'-kinase [Candidatus Aminicenantes bacterium]|nr:tetraacyldisaccharide 4'-kinase [Candidatus Aminicenantes bacterium]